MTGVRVLLDDRVTPQAWSDRRPAPPADTVCAHAASPVFVVNGRFYAQAVTGVQRYGREIVGALDPLLATRRKVARIALPRGAAAPPPFAGFAVEAPSRWRGHAWEQMVLPVDCAAPLLNLCNTGPVASSRQIVCLHDLNVRHQPGSYRPGFRLFYRALQPLLARRAAVLTTVSEASAADLAHHLGVERRRIAVLPNGHEHALRWRPEAAVLGRWPRRRPFVLLLGSRARHKNTALLLQLAPALDALGLDLVIVGGGGAVFAAETAGGLPRGNVHRLGPVSDDELAALLGHALCLAFPSWTEGFGLPVVEAMAHGCPVISSDRASLPEVCGRAALLAPPNDPDAWLAAIAALHRSPGLQAELAGRGVEQMRRFSWAASAQGYLDLLERLA